jgi:hypothetical protein
MNELNVAAQGVNTAWCKTDLRREAESKAEGDSFCALGHMAVAQAAVEGMIVSLDGDYIGTPEAMANYDRYILGYRESSDLSPIEWEPSFEDELFATYDYVRGQASTLVLAETIMANYRDRIADVSDDWIREHPEKVVYMFNDNDSTTREDVVAMMEKAALSLDDARAFEEKTTDDLVAEMDELLAEKV